MWAQTKPPVGRQEGLQGALRTRLYRSLYRAEGLGRGFPGDKDFLPLPSRSCSQGHLLLWLFCSGVHFLQTLSAGTNVRTFCLQMGLSYIQPLHSMYPLSQIEYPLWPQMCTLSPHGPFPRSAQENDPVRLWLVPRISVLLTAQSPLGLHPLGWTLVPGIALLC